MLNDIDSRTKSRDICNVDRSQAGRETLSAAGAPAEERVGWLGKVRPTSTRYTQGEHRLVLPK